MNGDFSHLIYPAIILIVAIARMMGRARQAPSGSPPVSRPAARPPAESEAERQRRFLEAVGLPPGSQLPPQVSPRTGANPAPLQPINPPSVRGIGRLRRVATGAPPAPGSALPQAPGRRIVAPVPMPTRAPAPAAVPAYAAQYAPAMPVIQASAPPPPTPPAPRPAPAAVAPAVPAPVSGLLLRLRDPGSIRQAIILREILGPPRAFQPIAAGPAGPWMGR